MVEGPSDPRSPEPTSFAAFDHLLDTRRRTHAALHAVVHDEARDGVALRRYADIAAPHSEGELLLRAEELVRVVWRVAVGDERRDEPLRRTLAFYEAGSRLPFRGFLAA